uniref:Uncharacterized protein n=1 Tax=Anguilla anguilla TaxID=7936 RepID=A0A0E9V2G7_ANGAN
MSFSLWKTSVTRFGWFKMELSEGSVA